MTSPHVLLLSALLLPASFACLLAQTAAPGPPALPSAAAPAIAAAPALAATPPKYVPLPPLVLHLNQRLTVTGGSPVELSEAQEVLHGFQQKLQPGSAPGLGVTQCYALRNYRFRRASPESDRTEPAGSSTCLSSKAVREKSIIAGPR